MKFGFSRIATHRRNSLLSVMSLDGLDILEIGPLDNPTVMKDEANVYYTDWFSGDELREQLKKTTREVERVVDVDYVVKDRKLEAFIDKKFDLIIANHVIEHVPDLIYWADQLSKLSKKGGKMFLSAPDKRFTFDVSLPSSDMVDVYKRYVEGLDKADFYHALRFYFYFQRVNPVNIWNGTEPNKALRRMPFKAAVEMAREAAKEYSSLHCTIFEDKEFKLLWDDLVAAEFVRWDISRFFPTQKPHNEFHVVMDLMETAVNLPSVASNAPAVTETLWSRIGRKFFPAGS